MDNPALFVAIGYTIIFVIAYTIVVEGAREISKAWRRWRTR